MKRLISCLIFTVLMVNVLALGFNVKPARSSPATITVPDDYPTIQVAIDAASSGDTVYVKAGTYRENVVVGKALSLFGENPRNTIIDGGGVGNVVHITVDGVNVTGFTVRNSSNLGVGIYLDPASNCSITGNNITANHVDGIYLFNSSGNSVSGNNMANNRYGIQLTFSSPNNSVSGNNITNNRDYGIWLHDSSNYNSVSGNNITNNRCGIRVFGFSSYNNISGNSIAANRNAGISLYSTSNNSISRNTIANNNWEGIGLSSSSNSTVSGNNIANNLCGIDLEYSSDSIISGNKIVNNVYGIMLDYSSDNSAYHNNFVDDTIQAYSYIETINTWDDGYPSGGNYWSNYAGVDDKSGPNQDQLGSDGIVDVPYVIDAHNKDKYPLMEQFAFTLRPWDINRDGYCNAKDAVILGAHFGTQNGQPNYLEAADINGDCYINAKDAVILGGNFGQHWP